MFFTPAYLKAAKERQRLIKKIYYYRRNELKDDERKSLLGLSKELSKVIKQKSRPAIEQTMTESDRALKKLGGHYYRNFHFFDNVETLVVAAILAIGIRSFFLQPFKIPTNSMWPTYHGMTYTFKDTAEGSPLPQKIMKTLLQGSTEYRIVAPIDGTVRIPVFSPAERAQYQSVFAYTRVNKPILGLIPSAQREYTFYINDTPVSLTVPLEFSLDKLIIEKFLPGGETLKIDSQGMATTKTQARAGEALLSFDLETGDMLFADRLSYNFIEPKVGDPIVFRTRNVPGLTELNNGQPDDRYYIKRLVGLPGDELRIEDPILYRNGRRIDADAKIFQNDLKKVPPYPGYQAKYDFEGGKTITVPTGGYYAMGDNSPESLDSRVWGALPQKELVGRAVFIYYPFTSRWGFSK